MWTLNVNEEKKLLILNLSGTLTLDELSEFLKEIYDKNEGEFATFYRFVDLSALKVIRLFRHSSGSTPYVVVSARLDYEPCTFPLKYNSMAKACIKAKPFG